MMILVPQYGVLLFDNQSHKLITKLNEATTILSQYSNREAPSNDDCRNMFITLDEHPHIPDMYMFFIHPCGTSCTIAPIVEDSIDDYLICYLSSYGADYNTIFWNGKKKQH
ncbi:Ubiquitin-like-conjugating enzyme ATG10 [Entamoeba marina]